MRKTGDVWVYAIDGKTPPVRLTFDGGYYGGAWSVDGLWIAAQCNRGLVRIRADGGGQPETLLQPAAQKFGTNITDPSWSPDGGTLFFRANGNLWSYTMSTK